jgi:glycosyltransferase involved in cell wall biosynthesis
VRRETWINARFVTQPLTGVQRYAFEVCRRLPDYPLIAPQGGHATYRLLLDSPLFHCVRAPLGRGALAGHAWEQWTLPRRVPEDAWLWSPGGSGPLSVRRQVLTIHDIAWLEHPEWYGRAFVLWYRWLMPRLVRRVAHVITVSEFSKRRIVERLGVAGEDVSIVPLGVDERFRVLPPEEVRPVLDRLRVRTPYLLAVSALSSRKNLDRLLEGWRLLAPQAADLWLVVVGQAGLAFSDTGRAPEWPERTLPLGRVHDADLVALYNGALAYVYPSLYEGFGLPPLEAMACGAPVIAANATALPEVVGEAALLVDPLSVEAICDAMGRVVADAALREQLRAKGLRRIAEFSWDRTATQVRQTLQTVADRT